MINAKQDRPARLSAANITIKPKPLVLMERLRRMVAQSGSNKNDQAIVAITVCIGERVNTLSAICETLARLEFNTRHVAMIIRKSAGSDPARHRWGKDGTGRYHLLT